MCEGTGRSWEVSRGQGYTAAAWGRGTGWGTTLDVIDPSRWADAQANLTACARTVGISLSPKCRSQAACQKWGRQETSSQRPAWAALESAQAWSCLSPLGGQGRLQMEAGRGRGFSTGLAQAAQALGEAARPTRRSKDILRTASKPGVPRCVPQEPRSSILSRFSGAQSERASAGRFWVQLTLLGPRTAAGVDVAGTLGR